MKEPTWIKMVRLKGGIPTYAHPDNPEMPVKLFGSFHVRWPDGTVLACELKSKTVHTKLRDGTDVTGPYAFFEVPFNGMEVICNLNEIELRADEVAKSLSNTKHKAA